MNRAEFWKNFVLGDEVQIAGRFLYNGLCSFHEMDTLHYEDEIFEVLYNLSVGVERLVKVAVILIEHKEGESFEKVERDLKNHKHQGLVDRVKRKHALKLDMAHNDFIQLLSKFYNTHRYGRYAVGTTLDAGGEKRELHAFFAKHLGVVIKDEPPFQVARNSKEFRGFLGQVEVLQVSRTVQLLIFAGRGLCVTGLGGVRTGGVRRNRVSCVCVRGCSTPGTRRSLFGQPRHCRIGSFRVQS